MDFSSWYFIIIFLSLGLFFGTIAVIAGVGGGIFYVSFLTILFLIPIDTAVDTSTLVILLASSIGFITYLKDKRTTLKLTLIYSIFSILGGILCSIIFTFIKIDNTILRIIFATVLLLTGFNMIRKSFKTKREKKIKKENKIESHIDYFSFKTHDYKKDLKKGIPFFILAGFVANLLGIGGGVINTPALNIIMGFPIHNATAISTSIIFFTAIYNTIYKMIFGEINYLIAIFLSAGSILGSFLGAKISTRMRVSQLQFFVSIILLILAIRMYF